MNNDTDVNDDGGAGGDAFHVLCWSRGITLIAVYESALPPYSPFLLLLTAMSFRPLQLPGARACARHTDL